MSTNTTLPVLPSGCRWVLDGDTLEAHDRSGGVYRGADAETIADRLHRGLAALLSSEDLERLGRSDDPGSVQAPWHAARMATRAMRASPDISVRMAADVRVEPWSDFAYAEETIDNLASGGVPCLIAGDGRAVMPAVDAMVSRGWAWRSSISLLERDGKTIRVARSAEAVRGANVGAVWLIRPSPEMRRRALDALRVDPGYLLTSDDPTQDVLRRFHDRVMATDGPGVPDPDTIPGLAPWQALVEERLDALAEAVNPERIMEAFRSVVFKPIVDAQALRGFRPVSSEGMPAMTAQDVADAINRDPSSDVTATVDPVLPPGCRLESLGPNGWRVMNLDPGDQAGWGETPEEAAAAAWRSFGAFMSREDYEALVGEAGSAEVVQGEADGWKAKALAAESERDALRERLARARADAKRLAALVPPIRITRDPEDGVRLRAEFPDGSFCEERVAPNRDGLVERFSWHVSPSTPESLASEWAQAQRSSLDRARGLLLEGRAHG